MAVAAIVIAAIAIVIISFASNNSVIPTPQASTPAPTTVTTQTPSAQGKHHDLSLSEAIGVKEAP
ncbi:Uncharacterised protein [uncultured archaeon]|nr:Uncharacterised protein [uncultured archaeon]